MEGEVTMSLADLLTALLSVVTQIFGTGIGTVGTALVSNIVFQLIAGIAVGFILIRAFRKLVHTVG